MLHGNGMIVMDWQRRRTWTIPRLHDTTLHFFRYMCCEDLAIRILHLNLVCLYLIVFANSRTNLSNYIIPFQLHKPNVHLPDKYSGQYMGY